MKSLHKMDIIEFAEKVLEIKLTDAQKEILKDIESGKKAVIAMPKRPFKNTLREILEKYRDSEFAYVRIF